MNSNKVVPAVVVILLLLACTALYYGWFIQPTNIIHKDNFLIWEEISSRIVLVDLNTTTTETGPCLKSRTEPEYTLCIHNPKIDINVSGHFKNFGKWEGDLIPTIQSVLRSDSQLGFIDIGANIGTWGILTATMGHNTIMVEAFQRNTNKIRSSVQIGNLQKKVTLVQNCVSDEYAEYSAYMPWGASNQGALRMVPYNGTGAPIKSVHMDDLVALMPFKTAVLKIDIEGFEDKAMRHSEKLFKNIFIPYIFMEWAFPLSVYNKDLSRVLNFIENMTSKSYTPFNYGWEPLKLNEWQKWPVDMIWKHTSITI